MDQFYRRHPQQPKLDELRQLRLERYPETTQKDFAEMLGITRLHFLSVEMGRRRPSAELAMRWLTALGPKARLSMFGTLPIVEGRLKALKRLQKVAPDAVKAA